LVGPVDARGIHEDASDEGNAARRAEKAVDVGALNPMALSVEIALDRAPAIRIVSKLGHQVDTRVRLGLAAFPCPICEHHDAAVSPFLRWGIFQPDLGQPLEVGAFLPFRC